MPQMESNRSSLAAMRPLVLDTDIGTDVDDLLALLLILAEPAIGLVGVTTVHGDTELRARIVQAVLGRLGRASIPIVAGERATLSGTPVDWKGHEGQGIDQLPVYQARGIGAPEFLCDQARRAGGQLEILGIAPPTNLAVALSRDSSFASRVKHLFLMGGAFWPPHLEHNFVADPQATRLVLAAGIPTTIIGLDVTLKLVYSRHDAASLCLASNNPLAHLVYEQTNRWLGFLRRDFCHLHDPLAAVAITRPDLFRLLRGEVVLNDDLQTRLCEAPDGAARVAIDVDARAARELIFDRLRTALR
jgi:purine nucleosidase